MIKIFIFILLWTGCKGSSFVPLSKRGQTNLYYSFIPDSLDWQIKRKLVIYNMSNTWIDFQYYSIQIKPCFNSPYSESKRYINKYCLLPFEEIPKYNNGKVYNSYRDTNGFNNIRLNSNDSIIIGFDRYDSYIMGLDLFTGKLSFKDSGNTIYYPQKENLFLYHSLNDDIVCLYTFKGTEIEKQLNSKVDFESDDHSIEYSGEKVIVSFYSNFKKKLYNTRYYYSFGRFDSSHVFDKRQSIYERWICNVR